MNRIRIYLFWGLVGFVVVVFVISLFSKFIGVFEGVYIFFIIEDWIGLLFEFVG